MKVNYINVIALLFACAVSGAKAQTMPLPAAAGYAGSTARDMPAMIRSSVFQNHARVSKCAYQTAVKASASEIGLATQIASNFSNSLTLAGTVPNGGTAGSSDNRRFTLWIFGTIQLDYRISASGNFTVGLGVAGVLVNNSSNSSSVLSTGGGVNIGPMGDLFYFPRGKASGLAFDLRVGSANGIYVAPGIFYVSRPKGMICGRFGVLAPFGGGAESFLPEVALGFRF